MTEPTEGAEDSSGELPGSGATAVPAGPAIEAAAVLPGPAIEAAAVLPGPAIEAAAVDIDWPDYEAENATRHALEHAALPARDLGRLQELAVWLAGTQGHHPPTDPRRVRLIVFAADHGIAAEDIETPQPSAAQRASALTGEDDVAAGLAAIAGADIRVVDLPTSARIDEGAALSDDAVEAALHTGIRVADEEADAGTDLVVVGSVGAGADLVAATIISIMTNTEPVKVLGFDADLDDARWMRAAGAMREARRLGIDHRYDVPALLARVGGSDLAALTGFLLRAAARGVPVLLDGTTAGAAALLAREVSPRTVRWWQVAARGASTAGHLALETLGLDPLIDLNMSLDAGLGGLLALPVLRAAVLVAASAASAGDRAGDSAGVDAT